MKKINFKNILIFVVIAFLYILSRLPNLGYDTFNTDSWRWKQRSYDFGSGVFTLNFETTIQKYHPGVPLMWLGAIGVKIYNFYYDVVFKNPPIADSVSFIFELNFVFKLLITLLLGIVLSLMYFPLKSLFGKRYAIFALILFSLEPFYIALSREIHLEALMTTFMFASLLYWFYFLYKDSSPRYIILSGLFSALAVLTKSSGLFIVLFNGLQSLLFLVLTKKYDKSTFLNIISTGVSYFVFVIIFYFLVWPAMLVVPENAISTVIKGIFDIGVEGGHEQLYFGYLVDDPGPFYYYLVLLLRSSVYVIFGLFALVFVWKEQSSLRKKFIISLLLFAALYLIEIILPTKKLDRYVLPSLMALVWLAAFSLESLTRNIKQKVLLPLVFAPALTTLALYNPDYLSYFNPMFGGLRTGFYIFEPKWVIGQFKIQTFFENVIVKENLSKFEVGENIDDYLYDPEGASKKLIVAFPEKYYTQLWPFIKQIGGTSALMKLSGNASLAGYFVYPVWDDLSFEEKRYKIEYYDSIYVQGIEMYRVYKRIW